MLLLRFRTILNVTNQSRVQFLSTLDLPAIHISHNTGKETISTLFFDFVFSFPLHPISVTEPHLPSINGVLQYPLNDCFDSIPKTSSVETIAKKPNGKFTMFHYLAFNHNSIFSGRNVHYLVKQDQNRYSASRGAHLNLKRAEKARVLVSKITGKRRRS
ncbi:hypothetical protein YC2023_014436 [Brassica napus]